VKTDIWNDPKYRTLPLAWRRKCNNKLYGLTAVRIGSNGSVLVEIREVGTNRGLQIYLFTLARCYRAEEGYKASIREEPLQSGHKPSPNFMMN
jgi:hypothetical protein